LVAWPNAKYLTIFIYNIIYVSDLPRNIKKQIQIGAICRRYNCLNYFKQFG